jgi:hypothetical protein
MFKAIKTIRSHSGYARFLAECDVDDDGEVMVVREVPRQADIPSPYAYSLTWPVYRHNGKEIIIRETVHRCYQVFDASQMISIVPLGV